MDCYYLFNCSSDIELCGSRLKLLGSNLPEIDDIADKEEHLLRLEFQLGQVEFLLILKAGHFGPQRVKVGEAWACDSLGLASQHFYDLRTFFLDSHNLRIEPQDSPEGLPHLVGDAQVNDGEQLRLSVLLLVEDALRNVH